MNENQILNLITTLGFEIKEDNLYSKKYGQDDYTIVVDFGKKKISYGDKIKRGDETTSNLFHAENLVVLECINRLLEKGYEPEDLHLEKKWKLGRSGKSGKADISVKGKDGKSLIIIECKTFGNEYIKELKRMGSNGGQLFSYFQQDKNTRYLCLYASELSGNNKIETQQTIIKVDDSTAEKVEQQEKPNEILIFEQAKTVKELVEVWKKKDKKKKDKITTTTGIFEEGIEPYNPGYKPIRIKQLKEFEKGDTGKTFNVFEEILRHNNISDRSNAFNRIISLILAKIVDETKGADEIAGFQVKTGIDDAEALQERLQRLYSKAMKDFLHETVIDYTMNDIKELVQNFPRQTTQENLMQIYRELKFYHNNEFAFKEVYNKELFEANAAVLEEVVKLFQPFKFKYNRKAQFLGDLFENLLESGFKQTEGQFFTPTPIAKFIISSLPLKELIIEKLENEDKRILPQVIDFACGSGHFLTETIEDIQSIIKNIDSDNPQLKEYRENTLWAADFIFGIEKDYRLARTSQVACYMHGDGEANIIFGDGLELHERIPKNDTFDVLVANPPYAIRYFKNHLRRDALPKYALLDELSDDAKEIEVMFIERMKQLLRPGGVAGIFLPSTILSNPGIYAKAREIILKYFEIKAIVEFGSVTFSATSAITVALFLKRRDDDFVKNCEYIAEDFILNNKERKNDFVESEQLFKEYVELFELNFEDFKSLISRQPNENIQKTEFYKNYRTWFVNLTNVKNQKEKYDKALSREENELKQLKDKEKIEQQKQLIQTLKEEHNKELESLFYDKVLQLEKEKFLYFLLTHRLEIKSTDDEKIEKTVIPQKILLIKSGRSNVEQKNFLGYSFSDRRGYKGMDFKGDTKLYDSENLFNPSKVNGYIYKSFETDKIKINQTISEHISQLNLLDCLNFTNIKFANTVNFKAEYKVEFQSKYVLKQLDTVCEFQSGLWKGKQEPYQTIKVLRNTDFISNGYLSYESPAVIEVEERQLTSRQLEYGDIILERSGGSETQNIGRVAYFDYKGAEIYSFGNFTSRIRPLTDKELLPKFLWIILNEFYNQGGTLYHQSGIRIKNLNTTGYKSVKIPIPPVEIQRQIIREVEKAQKKGKENEISTILSSYLE
ncbi:MAG: N-6 DNA methylase [Cytophagales bacterium]|nr:N-6 DNA methylase [Cytophagales bacterium]